MLTLEKQINETVPLTKEDWKNLTSFYEKRSLKKNESIIFDNKNSKSVFYILSGTLKISKESVKGSYVFFEVQTAGNFLGFETLISKGNRGKIARAIEDTVLLEISLEKLEQLASDNPPLALALHKALLFNLSHQFDTKNTQASEVLASSRLVVLGEMLANIVHEINNPLTTLRLLTSQLTDFIETLPEANKTTLELTEAVERTFEHLIKVINGVRISSRTGQSDALECISIQELLQSSINLCQGRLNDSACTLSLKINPKDLKIWCRPSQIIQVLINLICNAHDAVGKHDKGWIEVCVDERSHTIEFGVLDSGVGIPNGLEDKIFEPFYSTKPQGQGTGVGLSLSKQLIEQNGGELYYDRLHPHTRFYFTLPKRI